MVTSRAVCRACAWEGKVSSGKQVFVGRDGETQWGRRSLRQTPCPGCGRVHTMTKLTKRLSADLAEARRLQEKLL